jgi:hypothetical protein
MIMSPQSISSVINLMILVLSPIQEVQQTHHVTMTNLLLRLRLKLRLIQKMMIQTMMTSLRNQNHLPSQMPMMNLQIPTKHHLLSILMMKGWKLIGPLKGMPVLG